MQNFYDGKAIRFSADEALINGDFSEGIIRSANLLLDETIKIHTAEVILKDGEISSATGISQVTSCQECEGQDPNWYPMHLLQRETWKILILSIRM